MPAESNEVQTLLSKMRPHINEILEFDMADWDKLSETPDDKQMGVLAFLKKLETTSWQAMEDVHLLPCYDQYSMDFFQATIDKPIHAEHKRLRKAHAGFRRRWKRFQEKMNGTKADPKTTKTGDDTAKTVD